MRNILFFVLLIVLITPSYGQISYEKRIEFELKDGYSGEKIIEFGKLGFIISSYNEENEGDKTEWKFELYNTDLKLVKSKSINLSRKFYVDERFVDKNRIYTLFKDRKGNYVVVTIDAKTLEVTKVDGNVPKKSRISGMAILGDFAFFKTSIKKESFLFSVNWKTGKKNFIPVNIPRIKPKNLSLWNFQMLEESNEIFLFVRAIVDKRKQDIYIIKLNDKGQKEDTYNLTENIDQNIVSINASQLSNGKYIFTGTYSKKYLGRSEGMFFCQGTKGKIDFIKLYNFLELENFLSYLPEKKKKKIEKKKKKKERKGKEYVISYQIAPHGIIELEDGYMFIGEAYYPTYRTETYYVTTYINGVATRTPQYRTVFTGYQYTHAVIGKFDLEGKLVWDQTFKMWSTSKPFYVKRFISIAEKKQSSIKLAYSSHNKIFTKSFNFDGKVLDDFQSEEIKMAYDGDESKWTNSNLSYWYDNFFIAYGSQKIKNKEDKKKVKKKRKIYFVSKIKYQ